MVLVKATTSWIFITSRFFVRLCFYYESEIGYVRENSFTIPDENILHGHLLQRKVSLRVVLLAKILVDRRPEHLT